MKKKLFAIAVAALTLFVMCKSPIETPEIDEAASFTVLFDKNHSDAGGWTDADPVTKSVVPPAATIDTLPAPPARTNYVFGSWNTQVDGKGNEFTAATVITADTTVYAKWNRIYTVTFDKNHQNAGGIEANPATKQVVSATAIGQLPDNPRNPGYGFVGWYYTTDGTGYEFTETTVVTADTTVYAQWEQGAATVIFDKNHNDPSGWTNALPSSLPVNVTTHKIAALPSQPERQGYGFVGWYYTTDGTGYEFTETTVVTADTTVYAKWEQGAATVIFDKNHNDPSGWTNALPSSLPVNVTTHKIAALPVQPERQGYGFTGWNTKADGTGDAFTAATGITADTTVYAQWEQGAATVTFDKNHSDLGGTEANPRTITVRPPATTISALPAPPVRTNHDFAGWNAQADGTGDAFTAATGITADTTVYAQWTLREQPPIEPGPSGFPPAVPSGEYRNLFKEWGKTDAEINAKITAGWNQLFVNGTAEQKIFIEVGNDMAYIIDSGNNDVRSEGMSYGMMMCVQMNDKERFDKLWKWAHTYMYNDRTVKTDNVRGYFIWQCGTDGATRDRGVAPDGEFYFVTALLFASARWGDGAGIYEYGRIARHVLFDMINRDPGGLDNWGAHTMFDLAYHLPVFSTNGNAANHTDPSYNLPAFYDIWAIEVEEGEEYWDIFGGEAGAKTNAAFWKQAATASRAFFPTTVHATTGLGPDYAQFTGAPAGGEHQDFRYDAWRIAMNIGMDYAWWQKDPWQVEFADRIQAFFYSKGVKTYGSLWNLNGTGPLQNGADHSPGLVACNAVASLAASEDITWEFVEDFWNTNTTTGRYRYYDGCLYMMGLLHVTGNFKAYFPANRVTSSAISPATAVFDKNTASANNKDVTVTMTLNGNTLQSVKNGNTTLAQGSNYTVSGNTVTLSKNYLASLANARVTLTFVFSAGRDRAIDITVGDTTGGGPIGGMRTSYDFSVDTVTAEYNGAGLSAVVSNGVLVVTKTGGYSTPIFILPFDLGQPLSAYSSIEMEVRLISGDITGNKTLRVEARPEGTAFTASGSNPSFGTLSGGDIMGSVGGDWRTITITNGGGANSANSLSDSIKIGFSVNNTNPFVYQVRKITLKE